jgi:hypothetical protein
MKPVLDILASSGVLSMRDLTEGDVPWGGVVLARVAGVVDVGEPSCDGQ